MSKRKVQSISQKPSPISAVLVYRVVLGLFVIFVIYLLFFSRLLHITTVRVSGATSTGDGKITQIVEKELAGNYGGVFSKRNTLYLAKDRITESLTSHFKKIRSVSIKREFPSVIIVDITERDTSLAVRTNGQVWLIDERGNAFDQVSLEQTGDSVIILQDNSQREIDYEMPVVGSDLRDFLYSLPKQLGERMGLEIERTIETPTIISSDFRVTTREGWRIFFNKDLGLEKGLTMLSIVLKEKIQPENRSKLEYIDLRADNKVFYKLREGTEQETDTEAQEEEVKKEEPKKDEKKKKKK